ncbi:MAG: hypothetical protein SGILL_008418 [Bacillariaceae sp.]
MAKELCKIRDDPKLTEDEKSVRAKLMMGASMQDDGKQEMDDSVAMQAVATQAVVNLHDSAKKDYAKGSAKKEKGAKIMWGALTACRPAMDTNEEEMEEIVEEEADAESYEDEEIQPNDLFAVSAGKPAPKTVPVKPSTTAAAAATSDKKRKLVTTTNTPSKQADDEEPSKRPPAGPEPSGTVGKKRKSAGMVDLAVGSAGESKGIVNSVKYYLGFGKAAPVAMADTEAPIRAYKEQAEEFQPGDIPANWDEMEDLVKETFNKDKSDTRLQLQSVTFKKDKVPIGTFVDSVDGSLVKYYMKDGVPCSVPRRKKDGTYCANCPNGNANLCGPHSGQYRELESDPVFGRIGADSVKQQVQQHIPQLVHGKTPDQIATICRHAGMSPEHLQAMMMAGPVNPQQQNALPGAVGMPMQAGMPPQVDAEQGDAQIVAEEVACFDEAIALPDLWTSNPSESRQKKIDTSLVPLEFETENNRDVRKALDKCMTLSTKPAASAYSLKKLTEIHKRGRVSEPVKVAMERCMENILAGRYGEAGSEDAVMELAYLLKEEVLGHDEVQTSEILHRLCNEAGSEETVMGVVCLMTDALHSDVLTLGLDGHAAAVEILRSIKDGEHEAYSVAVKDRATRALELFFSKNQDT